MTRPGVLIGGVFTLAGCGCPSLATLNVQDPDGLAAVEQIETISDAAASFIEWTGRDSVCVDTIEVAEVPDYENFDAVGAYYGAGEPIRMEVGGEKALSGVVWHELGHALDDVEGIALAHGEAFPTLHIGHHYVGGDMRLDEAFAQTTELGPPPAALTRAIQSACGVVGASDEVMLDLVFPDYVEPEVVGVDDSARWERIGPLGGALYDVQPFEDSDGTAGLVGVSYIGEGEGYRYTFHRIVIGSAGAGLPSIVEDGLIDVLLPTGEGEAVFVPTLDGAVVVLVTQSAEDYWLATPDFAHATWSQIDLPGIVSALGQYGDATFEGGTVWWDVWGDGIGLQHAALNGEPLPAGDLDDKVAGLPYALSSEGGVYAGFWNAGGDVELDSFEAMRWDGAAWAAPDGLPRDFVPLGGSTSGDELARVSRAAFQNGQAHATAYKPAGGEWSIAAQTCGVEMSPLLIGGEWYGVAMDDATLGLYHWVP